MLGLHAEFTTAVSPAVQRPEFSDHRLRGDRVLSNLTMSTAEAPELGVELEKLLLVVQAGLRVRLRHHFFNWTQGPLQTLLPHDLLICGIAENGGCYQIDSVSCYPQSPQLVEALQRKNSGITMRLVQAWDRGGRDPLLVDASVPAALGIEMAEHKLGGLVAHGTCGRNGQVGTFFGFCRMREPLQPQHAFIAELLVPYVHAAWMRIHYFEAKIEINSAPVPAPAAPGVRGSTLTGREIEILRWVYEGKSNMEIGIILGISGLTVKNHVQNILRKLNVQNRTQAVGKGLLLNLLQGGARS